MDGWIRYETFSCDVMSVLSLPDSTYLLFVGPAGAVELAFVGPEFDFVA